MLNIGWGELLVIAVIVLFAFGPEDIPKIMYNIGRVVRRFRYMRYALSSQFEDFMEKAESAGRARGTVPPMREVSADAEREADDDLMAALPEPAATLPAPAPQQDPTAEKEPASGTDRPAV